MATMDFREMRKGLFLLFVAICILNAAHAQVSIADARAQGVGAEVTIQGIILNGSELGIIRYIQDETAAIGIYSFDDAALMTRGDSVFITGTVDEYQGLMELSPVSSLSVLSSGNTLPTPQMATPAQLSEDMEGELTTIENVTFNDGGSVMNGNTSYTFSNGLESATIYVRTGSPLVGQTIPAGTVTIVGICSQFFATYQMLLRDMDDFIASAGINLTSQVTTSDINTDGFTLNWSTNMDGSTEVNYGLTAELELGTLNGGVEDIDHTIVLTGLEAGHIYYAQAFSVAGNDTAFSTVRPYATESLSSGDITVYFNSSVDNTVSTGEDATLLYYTIDDTLIAYIDRAEESLDLTIYDFDNEGISNISEAINDAYDRGVVVRFISDGTLAATNFGVNELIPEIQKIASPTSSEYNIMHNKFVIIDANHEDPLKPIVWTGATNWTDRQINRDPNDVVIVQDQTLARAYTLEFEEMWGSNGALADTSESRFGAFKMDNTPHEFKVDGKRMECYFSPSDGTNNYLLASMATAQDNIHFCTMLITRQDLAEALIAAHADGLEVNGVIDDEVSTTQFGILSAGLGADLIVNADTNYMHHKYMIVDEDMLDSDPLLWVGSHNWSNNANTRNDENTLVIHDPAVVNQFYQEFVARLAQLPTENPDNVESIEFASLQNLEVYPNPILKGSTTSFKLPVSGNMSIVILDSKGSVIVEESFHGNEGSFYSMETRTLHSGAYQIVLFSGDQVFCNQLMVE